MGQQSLFGLMAGYNQWMNGAIYQAAACLSETILHQDRGAFFKSIMGTLNHILVADILWLKRFAQHPKCYRALQPVLAMPHPQSLDEMLYSELALLWPVRQELDALIILWLQEMEEGDLSGNLDYTNTKGLPYSDHFGSLIQHFFNHQTHHRGQVTTLLSQNGVDVGSTDLLSLIRG